MRISESITDSTGGLLRLPEAARLLGLKPATLRSWVLRRRMPFVRLSARAIRFRAEDIAKIISDCEVPAREERQ
jgi:excisionase family DNA binding protein